MVRKGCQDHGPTVPFARGRWPVLPAPGPADIETSCIAVALRAVCPSGAICETLALRQVDPARRGFLSLRDPTGTILSSVPADTVGQPSGLPQSAASRALHRPGLRCATDPATRRSRPLLPRPPNV